MTGRYTYAHRFDRQGWWNVDARRFEEPTDAVIAAVNWRAVYERHFPGEPATVIPVEIVEFNGERRARPITPSEGAR